MFKNLINSEINLGTLLSLVPVILFLIAIANILKDLQLSENMFINVGIGYGLVIIYRLILRYTIFKHYHTGMSLIKGKQYLRAIESFREYHDFFIAFSFLNKYHSTFLLTMSRYSPVEKSLLRMAYCYNIKKDIILERKCYEECLTQFPNNKVAQEALQNINSH